MNTPDPTRRKFIARGGAAAAGLVAAEVVRTAHAQHEHSADAVTDEKTEHEHEHEHEPNNEFPRTHAGRGGPVGSATDRGKLVSGYLKPGDPPVPVVMPDLETLKWEEKDGVKEFHLVAEHVRREMLPNQFFDVWGYNGSMPGPLIEATEGDRVRIIVHNKLPEATSMHWHGLEVPIAMDGVPGLTQNPIPPGEMFTYEFDLHQTGTFFYHSHGPMQEIIGMVGLFVIHPRAAVEPTVDYDFGLIVQEFAIIPLSSVPNTVSEEFNFFTINGRSGPYTTPLVVKLGSRVRLRFMNLSAMDHHPMHLHGHTFWITGTEAGRIPESAWIPSNTVLVGVGQSRDVEFIANNPGDWMLHCHILHHMMNNMVSMVGPMPSMVSMDHPSHEGVLPETKGGELASGVLGAGLEPSLGAAIGEDRAMMTGMRPSATPKKFSVPGYPQDMMEMHGMMSPEDMKKVQTPLTRGLRNDWPMASQAMMTILRVLPENLYEKVVSGKGKIEPGESSPGVGAGEAMDHSGGGHQMHGDMPMPEGHDMAPPTKASSDSSESSEHAH